MTLEDRVALVTGGSHGIGKAVVARFLAEGARVAFCGRRESDLETAAAEFTRPGSEVLALAADVSRHADVARLVGAVLDRFGRIDVLVNNAGVYGPIGPAWENDSAEWQRTIEINLLGTFRVCHEVVPAMIRAKCGKIVNMSGGGAATPFPRFTAYAVSKAAVVRFTETLALELAPHNIQVNAVAPGFVATRLHQETLAAGERAGADYFKKTQEQVAQGAVDPAIPAALVAYLAADTGDRITGKFISAVWDRWAEFGEHLDEMTKTDVYTLRRIVPADRGMGWK
ncbi:MAG: SDR family oxidoreductase [Candidatus Rokubacteria bacterium]|nr:SDR family oxidoreductase [Candidatus Rokubacteria bacterium]